MKIDSVVSSLKKAIGLPVEQKAYSLSDAGIAELFGVRPTFSGVNMGGSSALYVPAVLQAVRLISETIGSLPCKVYRETGGDEPNVGCDRPKSLHSSWSDPIRHRSCR